MGPDMQPGQAVAQGMIGVAFHDRVVRTGGADPAVGGTPSDLEHVPFLGGAWQEAYGGGRIDWGLEAGGTLGFRNGNGTVRSNLSGSDVDVDVELLLFDVFGGPFLSTHLGHSARVYASAGPLLQWATYAQDGYDSVAMETIDSKGTGLGLGIYTRAGIEFIAANNVIVGLGVRWLDSEVALNDNLGDLEVQGTQVMFTISNGF